jgi:hypothetical protein
MGNFLRRIRGALGNALTWGVAWFTGGLAIATGLFLTGLYPASAGWLVALAIAKNVGVTGFLTGGVFSLYLGVVHRQRQLHELRAGRLAFAGAVIAAVLSVGTLVLNGGLILPIQALVGDGLIAALLGAVTAGGTIRLSQRASGRLRGDAPDALEGEREGLDRLSART